MQSTQTTRRCDSVSYFLFEMSVFVTCEDLKDDVGSILYSGLVEE
jgi:hypothetical protein